MRVVNLLDHGEVLAHFVPPAITAVCAISTASSAVFTAASVHGRRRSVGYRLWSLLYLRTHQGELVLLRDR